jgi:hypothetical protein
MKKRFLVVVRAGDNSLHPQWLGNGATRSWDLIVNYYGDDPQRYRDADGGVVRIDSKGPKWPALHKLLTDTRDAWRDYDYIWLPDDDLATNCADIERMFELVDAMRLHLAQPSLSWNSHVSLPMTLHNPNFALRYSSFVEPMAPCFSRELLERVLPTFGEIISGWGLDYVWPSFVKNPGRECAILDCVQVTHTRPVGGPNYDFNRRQGVDPRAEMTGLLKKYGIPGIMTISYGGLDREGNTYNLFGPEGGEFIARICEGYLDKLRGNERVLGTIFAWHAEARRDYLAPLGTVDVAGRAPLDKIRDAMAKLAERETAAAR